MPKLLIILGCVLVAAGLLWPVLARLGLGHLPGDIDVRGERFRFYFPLATCLLLSLAASVLLWLFRR